MRSPRDRTLNERDAMRSPCFCFCSKGMVLRETPLGWLPIGIIRGATVTNSEL